MRVERIEPASADASFRRYFRVFRSGDALIVMDAPPDKEDVRPYLKVTALLESIGDPAPIIALAFIAFNNWFDAGEFGEILRWSQTVIDLAEGGSINGLLAGLNLIIELAVPEFNEEGGTMIVPGHGRICDESDVGDYRDMVTIVRDRIQDMVSKKMTLAQVKAAKPTFDYDGVYGSPTYTGDMFVEAVYRSLTAPVKPAQGSTSK